MRGIGINLFWAVAGLGLASAAVSAVQSNSRQIYQAGRFMARLAEAGFWSVVIVCSLVLVASVYFLIRWHKRDNELHELEIAKLRAETVTQIKDNHQSWLVNPLGLPILNASHDWRLMLTDGPEDQPDAFQAYRSIKFLEAKQAHRINIKGEDISGLLPSPTWPQMVNLFDMLPNRRGDINNVVLGVTVDESGRQLPVSVPLETMMHTATGGETGTGKSSMAYSVAYQLATAPQDVSLILADPAGTTWKTFSGSSRLAHPIISDEDELLHVLKVLLAECERRTEGLFAPYPTVEKLSDYNQIVTPDQRLGYIVTMIDEFPEWMENKEIAVTFRRLIRKSRKAGLFMFAMGTSWKHTDMDTSTRRQFLTKIHFMASDKDSSKTLLGDTRASELRDRGRAFGRFSFSATPDLIELQSAYIDKAQAMSALAEVGQGPAIGGGDNLPPAPPAGSIFDLPVAPEEDEPTPRQEIILDMFDDGESLNQISKAINQGRTGGKYNEEIKATVKKFRGTEL